MRRHLKTSEGQGSGMETSYLGGILERTEGMGPGRREGGHTPGSDSWCWTGPRSEVFVRARGVCCQRFTQGPLTLLIRGYLVRSYARAPLDLEATAHHLFAHYLEQESLTLAGLEGSFTLALLDGRAGRILLYRNLVGNGFTYYQQVPGGLLFGSNLAQLVEASPTAPRCNEDALPTYFLNRCVPGHETLFTGCYRLLPGEQIVYEDGRLTRTQRTTFLDLTPDRSLAGEPLDQLEATMSRILTDYRQLRPEAANLLSGGVDSSYLQVHWNRSAPTADRPPLTFCVSVDHPRSHPDTAYALSAAQMLGTEHLLVPADEPYSSYLSEAIAATAEPPNHVQTSYFIHLARAMNDHGASTGLCGEGADSLFGLDLGNQLQNAAVLRWLCPLRPLRRMGATVSGWLGWERLRRYFHLADVLYNQEDLAHPVNHAAVFADWAAVEACFGSGAVRRSAAARRAFLDRYHVPSDPLDRLHGAGFLGSAMNTAALKTTLFNVAGGDLLCPFLDSRLLRLVLNLAPRERFRFRKPKDLLKRSLARHAQQELAYRRKLGFGQPIFEWLAPGGVLRPLVEDLDDYGFVEAASLRRLRERPTWFLYSLVCFDLWHKRFIRHRSSRALRGPLVLAS